MTAVAYRTMGRGERAHQRQQTMCDDVQADESTEQSVAPAPTKGRPKSVSGAIVGNEVFNDENRRRAHTRMLHRQARHRARGGQHGGVR